MKNKKIIVIISLILIVIVGFSIFFIIKKNNVTNTQTNNDEQSYTHIITSTEDNKIEKDELEVKELKIQKSGSEISVFSTIINNSNSTINGFFMEIAIVNKNGEVLTSVVANYKEKIKPHESVDYTNFVTGEEININDAVDARIELLEKY